LASKAQQGDAKAWRDLQPILELIPKWETTYASPAQAARRALLEAVISGNPVLREAWELRAHAMITELAGPDATPLERTLCERIATCWLDMSLTDLIYASRAKDGMNVTAGDKQAESIASAARTVQSSNDGVRMWRLLGADDEPIAMQDRRLPDGRLWHTSQVRNRLLSRDRP
jgi:hypothetical protein